MMKALRLGIILPLLLVCGCRSVDLSKPMTSDDCLLVIPTEIIKQPGVTSARTYSLVLEGEKKNVAIPRGSRSLLFLLTRNERTRILSIVSKVTDSQYSGEDSESILEMNLTYEKQKIVIADFKIVQKIEKRGNNLYSWIGYEDLSAEEKREVWNLIEGDPRFSGWFE